MDRMTEGMSTFNILTVKQTGNRILGWHRHIWKDNIRMDPKEIGINTRNWIQSTQDRYYWRALGNATLNLRVPQAMKLVIT